MNEFIISRDMSRVTQFEQEFAAAVIKALPIGTNLKTPIPYSDLYDKVRNALEVRWPDIALTQSAGEKLVGGFVIEYTAGTGSGATYDGGVFRVVVLDRTYEVGRYECNFFTPQKA